MVGVVAVVDVGDGQVRLEDGGFEGHETEPIKNKSCRSKPVLASAALNG
jgi:hypothetical protein